MAIDLPIHDAKKPDGKDIQGEYGSNWKGEIERAEKYFASWHMRCEKIEKLYLMDMGKNPDDRSFPLLWSNISVLQPAIYTRSPIPAVERRWKDSDPVGRQASEMLERVLVYQVEAADLDAALRQSRDDYLLFGRGTVWMRYEADI